MALSVFKPPSSSSSFPPRNGANPFNNPSDSPVHGNVLKWTNFVQGWQRRWAAVEGRILIYTRPLCWREKRNRKFANGQLTELGSDGSLRVHGGPGLSFKIFFAKVTGYRISRSDERKFFISTARKTVELKASREPDRQDWMKALAHARDKSQASHISFRALRAHLFAKGLAVGIIQDCEEIILREVTNTLQQPGIETDEEGAGRETGEASQTIETNSLKIENGHEEASVGNGEELQKRTPAFELGGSSIMHGINAIGIPVSFRTLRAHLLAEGLAVGLIQDCERIILRELANSVRRLRINSEHEGAVLQNGGNGEASHGERGKDALALSRENSHESPISFRSLRAHLLTKGLTVGLIQDCERIILREVRNTLQQFRIDNEHEGAGLENGEASKAIERGTELPDSLKHELQGSGLVIGEASQTKDTGNSSVAHGNPTAEASEENEPMFFDAIDFLAEASQEPEPEYFDASDVIPDSTNQTAPAGQTTPAGQTAPASQTNGQTEPAALTRQTGPTDKTEGQTAPDGQTGLADHAAPAGQTGQTASAGQSVPAVQPATDGQSATSGQSAPASQLLPSVQRRSKLPEPREKGKEVSLWSVLKDSVGKDVKNINLPITFHEPLSSLQKWCEEFEYSYLLDEAHEAGKTGNSLMRAMKVAAFAVASYASYDGRSSKPFNPLLGETYEADFPEKGICFIAEKVSHHPLTMACHCEGRGWKFWGDNTLKSKFRGSSIQLDPSGSLFVEFDDGEIFTWAKVNSSINNLVLGKPYFNLNGTMNITGNRHFSSWLKFKESSILDRMPRKVQGCVTDLAGNEVASLKGDWNDSLYCQISKSKNQNEGPSEGEILLWVKNESPAEPTRYNFSLFGVTLNEITADLEGKLPPTDSRLRPDQRSVENGEFDRASMEKQKLEEKKMTVGELEEDAWQPKWFRRDDGSGAYRYAGGYWEAKEGGNWAGCPNLFADVASSNSSIN